MVDRKYYQHVSIKCEDQYKDMPNFYLYETIPNYHSKIIFKRYRLFDYLFHQFETLTCTRLSARST